MKTIAEASKHIYQSIQDYDANPDVDETIIASTLKDICLDIIGEKTLEQDVDLLESHIDDDGFLEEYFQMRIANYSTILEGLCKDILAEYIATPEGDLDEDEEEDLA